MTDRPSQQIVAVPSIPRLAKMVSDHDVQIKVLQSKVESIEDEDTHKRQWVDEFQRTFSASQARWIEELKAFHEARERDHEKWQASHDELRTQLNTGLQGLVRELSAMRELVSVEVAKGRTAMRVLRGIGAAFVAIAGLVISWFALSKH